jgi:carbonic anhydrase
MSQILDEVLAATDLEQSVIDDVKRIRSHPLVPGYISIYGYIYDVKSGRLIAVKDAASSGCSTRETSELSFEDG